MAVQGEVSGLVEALSCRLSALSKVSHRHDPANRVERTLLSAAFDFVFDLAFGFVFDLAFDFVFDLAFDFVSDLAFDFVSDLAFDFSFDFQRTNRGCPTPRAFQEVRSRHPLP